MRIPSAHQRRDNGVAMTPMIDVVFLLLIFFVCTASFQIAERILPSRLIAAGSQPTDPPAEIDPPLENVIVRARMVAGQPAWTINERVYPSLGDVRGVLSAVFAIDASVPVILDVAGNVPLGSAIDVYDLCRVVGFDRVQFAASAE